MPLRWLVLVVLAVGACRRAEPHAATPLLWKIERDGKTSYAFGTMHAGIDPRTAIAPVVWTALDSERAFAMETDLSRAASVPMVRRDGSWLHDELGPDYWAKLEAAIGSAEASRVDGMKPMIAATLLSLRAMPPTAPIDGALLAHAQVAGKPIVYLERVEDELAVLDRWYDARVLRQMLDDPGELDRQAKDMLAAYRAGDEAAVLEITLRDHTFDAAREDVLYRRNASWIAGIEQLHADGGGFIAVGAAHLVGPHSVLALLEERGYRITRIR
jgi:uncharacterized protein YbaP (TraB family)